VALARALVRGKPRRRGGDRAAAERGRAPHTLFNRVISHPLARLAAVAMSDPTSQATFHSETTTMSSSTVNQVIPTHRLDCGSYDVPDLLDYIRSIDLLSSWDLPTLELVLAFVQGFIVTGTLVTCSTFSLDWHVILPLVFGLVTTLPRICYLLRDSRVTGSPTASVILMFCGRIAFGTFIATIFAQLAGVSAGVTLGLVTVAGTKFDNFYGDISRSIHGDKVALLVGGGLILAMDALVRLNTGYITRVHAEIHARQGVVEPEIKTYGKGLSAITSGVHIGSTLLCTALSFIGLIAFNGINNPFLFLALSFFKKPDADAGWVILAGTIGSVLGFFAVMIFARWYNVVGPVHHIEHADQGITSASGSAGYYPVSGSKGHSRRM
jgi:hypothetical protein